MAAADSNLRSIGCQGMSKVLCNLCVVRSDPTPAVEPEATEELHRGNHRHTSDMPTAVAAEAPHFLKAKSKNSHT